MTQTSVATTAPAGGAIAFADQHLASAPLRLLIIADRWGPTQEISFAAALRRWRDAGAAALSALDECALTRLHKESGVEGAEAFIASQFAIVRPTVLVLSRYGGIDHPFILSQARQRGIPVVFHLDDDIFEVPIALGVDIYRRYRNSRRLHAFHRIAEAADVIYVSTPELAKRVRERVNAEAIYVADIYAGADLPAGRPDPTPPKRADEVRIGYMGSAGHAFDFEYVLEPMHAILRRHENVTFHLFGSITGTDVAKEFAGDRVTITPNVMGGYWDFRARLAELAWDIGLAPLRPTDFNKCKAPTKWVEYSQAGTAVLASDVPAYRRIAEEGAARLCQPEGWETAIEDLVVNPDRRTDLVRQAREILARDFSWRRAEEQLLDLVAALKGDGAILRTV